MQADTLAIIDGNNQTQWTRAATAPLREAAQALAALQAQTGEPLQLIRSFVDKSGAEVLVEFLTTAAHHKLKSPDDAMVTVEVWHRNPPDFFYRAGQPVDRAMFVPVAHFTLPTAFTHQPTMAELLPDAESALDAVYADTQNIDSAWNPAKPCRSTSVGDVLVLRSGNEKAAFAVVSIGFAPCEF